jgi:transcription elongation factor Elf1
VLRLIHERLAELARQGYRHHPVTEAVRAKERAARAMSCPECNHRGLHFGAFAHPARPGHIALAWCDICRVAVDVQAEVAPGARAGAGVAATAAARR